MTSPTENFTDPAIAVKQRIVVDPQLKAMHSGNPQLLFQVIGNTLHLLKERSGQESVTLLDAGCGSAYYSEVIDFFVPGWAEYTGCDFNLGMVELARQCYPDITVYQRDLRNLRFPDRSFDIVLSGAAIVHIKEWKAALGELARVADKWLLLHRTPIHDAQTTLGTFRAYDQELWFRWFNQQEIVDILVSAGFEMITSEECEIGMKTYLFERKE